MTIQDDLERREVASDLMDGRLRGDAFSRAVELAQVNSETRTAWHVNHLIGDILRFGETGSSAKVVAADSAFVDRFRRRFEQARIPEWTGADALAAVKNIQPVAPQYRLSESANSSIFRWKLLAGFTSMAAAAAIAWGAWPGLGSVEGSSAPQLANMILPALVVNGTQVANAGSSISSGSVAATEPSVMIRDPNLDALLTAHKQFGGTSALQMPAGFLRNATFEGSSR